MPRHTSFSEILPDDPLCCQMDFLALEIVFWSLINSYNILLLLLISANVPNNVFTAFHFLHSFMCVLIHFLCRVGWIWGGGSN